MKLMYGKIKGRKRVKMLELMNRNENKTMTSLEVAEITNKQHSHIMRDIRDEIDKLGYEIGQSIFGLTEYVDKFNRKQSMYLLTLDGIMQLGARYSAEIRYKLIQIAKEKLQPKQYTTKELLLMQLESIEKIEKLELENKQKQEVIEYQKPKVEYTDNVLKSDTLINISQIAKDFNLSGTGLNKILCENKIQYKQGKQYNLYQKYMNMGLAKSYTYLDINGSSHMCLKWTEKGRKFIYKLLKELGYIYEEE